MWKGSLASEPIDGDGVLESDGAERGEGGGCAVGWYSL